MPRLLSERLGDDTILRLKAAAKARRQTALHLHKTGFGLAAVYFYGYAAEQTVKAAYFRTVGFSRDGIIEKKNCQIAVDEFKALGLLIRPGPHDIYGWSVLLIAKRTSSGRPYTPAMENEIANQAGAIRRRWNEIIRYRTNIPYQHELRKMAEAALWFEQNYPAMFQEVKMPVIRQDTHPTVNRADLVKELAQEWKGDTRGKQPLIYENEIARTGSLHVLVVWDKWADVEDRERSAMILEAFDAASSGRHTSITIALGLTMEEAITMGYFPYKVEPASRKTDPVRKDEIEKAMLAENATKTNNGLELRYRTLQEAVDVYERLNSKQPGCWTVTEQVTTTGAP